jgi:hypothetical protein
MAGDKGGRAPGPSPGSRRAPCGRPLKQLLIGRFDGGKGAMVVTFESKREGLRIVPGEQLDIWRGRGSGNSFSTRCSQNMR